MIRLFLLVILLLFFIPVEFSFAQGIKIYSGFLYQQNVKSKPSFWHGLFAGKSSKHEEAVQDKQCSVEFISPVAFSHQSTAVIPDHLTYLIRFKDGSQPSKTNASIEKAPFKKFIVKIYTVNDEDYSIDPDAEGKQVGINDEHHIFDSYLIYLILGSDIDHLEIVSSSGNDQGKYVLDKLEIQDHH